MYQNHSLAFDGGIGHLTVNSNNSLALKERLQYTDLIDSSEKNLRINTCRYQLAWQYLVEFHQFYNAFELLELTRLSLEENRLKNNVLYAMVLKVLAVCYYHFEEFEQAKNHFFTWYIHPNKYSVSIQGNLNDFALSLQQLERHDFAFLLFEESLKLSESLNDTLLKPLIYGNMAKSVLGLGYKDEAIKLLQKDFNYSLKQQNYVSAANALMIFLKINFNLSLEQRYRVLKRAERLYELGKVFIHSDLLLLMSNWYFESGDYKKAFSFLQRSQERREFDIEQKDKSVAQRIGFEVFKEQHAARLYKDKMQTKFMRLFYFFTVIFVLSIAFYTVFAFLKEKRLHKKSVIMNAYRTTIVMKELESKKEQLEKLQMSLVQNSQSLSNMESLLRSYRESSNSIEHEKSSIKNKLSHFSILTEEDWHEFKLLFSSVYPNFLNNLENNHPNLSEAEKRHACLLRLNKSSFEIANILAISKDSVRQSNHRLRRKLNFSEQTEMIEFLFSVPT